MELIEIKENKDFNRAKALYREAFPAEERAPFFILKSRAKRGKADFWQLADGEERAGFAYVISRGDLSYLYYFAVEPSLRGKGCGTAALDLLKERYAGNRLFLALETPGGNAENEAQRVRRHAFYRRCGFEDLPGRIREAGVVYSVMGIGGAVCPDEYNGMIDGYLGPVRRRLMHMRMTD